MQVYVCRLFLTISSLTISFIADTEKPVGYAESSTVGIGNAPNFLTRSPSLAPLFRAFASHDEVEFHCVNAPNEVEEAPRVAEYYCGPYLGWLTFPKGHANNAIPRASLEFAMEFIAEVVKEEGPFNGILGFSQGANVAFYYLLHQLRTRPFDPPFVPFACAIFLSASGSEKDYRALMDSIEDIGRQITIPTLHIYGKEDVNSGAAMAMHQYCAGGEPELILHPKGHVIPGDVESVQLIVRAIRGLGRRSAISYTF
jgi:pimeloyl-ACP methyl ester carboxylesterase